MATITLAAATCAGACKDSAPSPGNPSTDDGGSIDVKGQPDAGDSSSPGRDGSASGACDATGTMLVNGETVVQLSLDNRVAVTRGRLVAPDGSKLVTTLHSTRGATTNRAFFVGTPGCTGLCYADPESLAQDGTLRATVMPGAPSGIEAISTSGTGGGAIVLASNAIMEIGTGGPTDATFAANGLWSGSFGVSYACGTPHAFSAVLGDMSGQPTFDIYFVAECTVPATSVSVYGHVAGSYTKGAGYVRTTYEILGSNESSAKRYAVLGFERFSRPEPFFPYREGLTLSGALHVSAGVFVFDTNDYVEVCDPLTGARMKTPPYR